MGVKFSSIEPVPCHSQWTLNKLETALLATVATCYHGNRLPSNRHPVVLRIISKLGGGELRERVKKRGRLNTAKGPIPPIIRRAGNTNRSTGVCLQGSGATTVVHRCTWSTETIETAVTRSAHTAAHGLEAKVHLLNLSAGTRERSITLYAQVTPGLVDKSVQNYPLPPYMMDVGFN